MPTDALATAALSDIVKVYDSSSVATTLGLSWLAKTSVVDAVVGVGACAKTGLSAPRLLPMSMAPNTAIIAMANRIGVRLRGYFIVWISPIKSSRTRMCALLTCLVDYRLRMPYPTTRITLLYRTLRTISRQTYAIGSRLDTSHRRTKKNLPQCIVSGEVRASGRLRACEVRFVVYGDISPQAAVVCVYSVVKLEVKSMDCGLSLVLSSVPGVRLEVKSMNGS